MYLTTYFLSRLHAESLNLFTTIYTYQNILFRYQYTPLDLYRKINIPDDTYINFKHINVALTIIDIDFTATIVHLWNCVVCWPRINLKTVLPLTSYRISIMMIRRPWLSCLYNGNSYTGKTATLYWNKFRSTRFSILSTLAVLPWLLL